MDVPPRKLPPKKDVMIALLAESNVFVHLDPRREGVIVPKWLQNQPELILQLGLNMPIPIHDLEVEDDSVSCTLSFSRTPFWCKLPWSAIFAIVSEKDRRGVVWPEDVPSESQLRGAQKGPAPKPRPKLTALGPNDRLEDAEARAGGSEIDEASDRDEPREERTPPADAKCSDCATRWPEEQTSCPVCGSSEWTSSSAASDEASSNAPGVLAEPASRAKATSEAATSEAATSNAAASEAATSEAATSEAAASEAAASEAASEAGAQDANAKRRSSARPRSKGDRSGLKASDADGDKREKSKTEAGKSDAAKRSKRGDASAIANGTAKKTLSVVPPPAAEASAADVSAKASAPVGEKATAKTIAAESAAESPRETPSRETPSKEASRERDAGESSDPAAAKKPSKRPLPPYLRVVK